MDAHTAYACLEKLDSLLKLIDKSTYDPPGYEDLLCTIWVDVRAYRDALTVALEVLGDA